MIEIESIPYSPYREYGEMNRTSLYEKQLERAVHGGLEKARRKELRKSWDQLQFWRKVYRNMKREGVDYFMGFGNQDLYDRTLEMVIRKGKRAQLNFEILEDLE